MTAPIHQQLILGSLIMVLSSTIIGCSVKDITDTADISVIESSTIISQTEVDFNKEIVENNDYEVSFDTDIDTISEQFNIETSSQSKEMDSAVTTDDGAEVDSTGPISETTVSSYNVFTEDIKLLLDTVTDWEYKTIEATYISEMEIPDSEYYRKDIYGNYIIPDSMFNNMETIFPIMLNGSIPYRYALKDGSGIGEPVNPIYEHYHKHRELFAMNVYWSEVNNRWLEPISMPIKEE